MAIKRYKYNDKTQLSKHFNVKEFKCKCGAKHDILIDSNLVPFLEQLMTELGSTKCNIVSGYRCASHDKKVGGKGSGSHVEGYAADVIYYKGLFKINSKDVVLAAEKIGHKKGLAYRSGKSQYSTHIDTKNRKWYADEYYSPYRELTSFYTYFGEKKEESKPQPTPTPTPTKKYIQINAISGVVYRKGIGFKYAKTGVIPNKTKCELITKNAGKSNGYNWDKIIYNGKEVYIPSKWNKYL